MENYFINSFHIEGVTEKNKFVCGLLDIGENYIKFLLSRNKIYLTDIDPKDAAVDLLAEIFTVEGDTYIKIKEFFDSHFLDKDLTIYDNYITALRAFIYTIITNNLPNLYKDSEPYTFHIFRNIKESVKKLNYTVTVHFSDKYIHRKKPDFHLEMPNKDYLTALAGTNNLSHYLNNTPAFLEELFDLIENDKSLCPAVRLNDVVYLFKHLTTSDYIQCSNKQSSDDVTLNLLNIKFILDEAKISFSAKLQKYITKNNLSQNFYGCMYSVIEEMISDYQNGTDKKSVMELMKNNFDEYDKYLFYKVQYCIEIFENEVSKSLKKENYLIG